MINKYEVYETNQMIAEENLDVRTITLGITVILYGIFTSWVLGLFYWLLRIVGVL